VVRPTSEIATRTKLTPRRIIVVISFSLYLENATPTRFVTGWSGDFFWYDFSMQVPRSLNTTHLFTPPAQRRDWETRAAALKKRLLFASGLSALPERTPLRPIVTGKVELAAFTVENIAIETLPGFFLCGNLYRPRGYGKGSFPAIVQAHGHWENGRLEREPDVEKAAPPPAKPAPGRADLVSLAANLAMQGFVVFAYDMVGYNGTGAIAHRRFGAAPEHWLWSVSELGLQTWNSLRAVDYVTSLPDVDAARIGATGASGGATQVFLLAALDPRIKVSVPVNMVSATMQGGCNCENGPGLRVDTDNPEIAALFAPKPQLLVCCTGDWTANVPKEVAPTIQKIYHLYGAEKNFSTVQFNYQHNYNVESREAAAAFFRKHLQKDASEKSVAEKSVALEPARLKVWTATHPMPGSQKNEAALTAFLKNEHEQRVSALWARGEGDALRQRLVLSLAVSVPKKAGRAPRKATLFIGDNAAAFRPLGDYTGHLETLVFETPLPAREKLWAEFFACYNQTPIGVRVQQVVDKLAALRQSGVGTVDLVGFGAGGAVALLTRAVAPELVGGTTICDLSHAPTTDAGYVEQLYAPGIRALGGLDTAVRLAAKSALTLFAPRQLLRETHLPATVRIDHTPPRPDLLIKALSR